MTKDEIFLKIKEYKDLFDFKEIVPVSALKNKLETMEVTAGEDYWCLRHSL